MFPLLLLTDLMRNKVLRNKHHTASVFVFQGVIP
jgi:hypothetical protein